MNTKRSGNTTQMLVGVIALVVIALGVWYFVSDPFHTKVNTTYSEWTKWTPEAIAKDPKNYLNFCEEQAKKAKEKLKVSNISVRQSIAKLEGVRDENKAKAEVGAKALDELREVFNQGAAVTWPVTWRNKSFDEAEFKQQAKRLDRETKSAQQLCNTAERGVVELKAQLVKIKDGEGQADEQLATIASKREMLNVQTITQDLTTQLVDMKGMLQGTIETADNTSKVTSLADLTAAQNATVSDSEFNALMKKK